MSDYPVPHTLTTEWGDTARLEALDFPTQRVVVRWGSDLDGWTSGYQLTPGGWRMFRVAQGWSTPAEQAARLGGQDLGPASFDTLTAHYQGPGVQPLGRWLRDEADRLVSENRGEDAARRAIRPAGGRYTPDQQAQLATLDYDYTLPTSLTVLAASPGTLEVVGAWLASLRRKLTHGADLLAIAQARRVPLFGGAEVDRVVLPLVAVGLVRPYSYEPVPGTAVGESAGILTPADQLKYARQGGHPSVGMLYWLHGAGPRYRELPEYSV